MKFIMVGMPKKKEAPEEPLKILKNIECKENECNEKEKTRLLSSNIPSDLGSNYRFYENSETNSKMMVMPFNNDRIFFQKCDKNTLYTQTLTK